MLWCNWQWGYSQLTLTQWLSQSHNLDLGEGKQEWKNGTVNMFPVPPTRGHKVGTEQGCRVSAETPRTQISSSHGLTPDGFQNLPRSLLLGSDAPLQTSGELSF